MSITDTVGTYETVRTPDSVASRIRLVKGNLRVTGTASSASPANYVDLIGAIANGAPTITAGGSDTDVNLSLVPQGAGAVTVSGSGGVRVSSTISISAAGTTQGTATLLTSAYNGITTVGAGSGVLLKTGVAGDSQVVFNGGANPVNVYPPTGAHINQLANNIPHDLANNTACKYCFFSATLVVGILSA